MAGDSGLFSRHLVAFVDLLGFKSIINSAEGEAAAAILETLQEVARTRRNFAVTVTDVAPGQKGVSATPAVTAFSDCTVISFDLDELEKTSPGPSGWGAMSVINKLVGRLSHRARDFGALVRGGVTVGSLHHRDGVVFGKGMVSAYELEQSASGPRIVVDDRALATLGGDKTGGGLLFQSDTGDWCLDYARSDLEDVFADLSRRGEKSPGIAARAWALVVYEKAMKEAERLGQMENGRASKYWRCFASDFKRSMKLIKPGLFEQEKALQFPDD